MIKVGIPELFCTMPLSEMAVPGEDYGVEIVVTDEVAACKKLLANELDCALVSPICLARHASKLTVHRQFVVQSRGAGASALLFFRESLENLTNAGSFAPDRGNSVLTKIFLSEAFEQQFTWHQLEGISSVDQLLSEFDAVLIEQFQAIEASAKAASFLDMHDEWSTHFDIPFVHLVLVTRREDDSSETSPDLVGSYLLEKVKSGLNNLKEIERRIQQIVGTEEPILQVDLLVDSYLYLGQESAWEALQTYLEFLFYYGVVDYPAQIHWGS